MEQKGITLIALIITIIIMLILVAVTVNIAIDGNLFGKAEDAVDKTNRKVGDLQRDVDYYKQILDKINTTDNDYYYDWNDSNVDSVSKAKYNNLKSILEEQIRSLNMGATNAQDAISLILNAKGALNEIVGTNQSKGILNRMKDVLTEIKSENTEVRRNEIAALINEYDRIIDTTSFNGHILLNSGNSYNVEFGSFEQGDMIISIPDLNWNIVYGTSEIDYNNIDAEIAKIDNAIRTIQGVRNNLEAKEIALGYKINYLDSLSENICSIHSRIFDTDMEEAMKKYEQDPTNQEILGELSSGYASIPHALDNAKKWRVTIGFIKLAEQGLEKIDTILGKIEDISTKACNGTLNDADRQLMQLYIDELTKQIDEILRYCGIENRIFFDGSFQYVGNTTLQSLGLNEISVLTYENANTSLNKVTVARQTVAEIREALTTKQEELTPNAENEANTGYAFDV